MLRLQLMLRFFDSPVHFAQFLGVSDQTLWRWMTDRSEPDAAALRLLSVLERLEGTELHAALVSAARPAPKPPRVKRKRRVRGVNSSSLPTVAPVARENGWPDAYWRDRSLTPAEMTAGEVPPVEDTPAMLARMSDAAYARYTESCNAYLRRTGRVIP